MQTFSDNQLRQLARKRVEFKSHLMAYCIIICSCWVIWAAMGRHYPWPIWPMVGWGVGLVFHYLFEYRPAKFLSEDEEYKKLKQQYSEKGNVAS